MKTGLKRLVLLVGIALLFVPSGWAQTQPGGKITIKLSHTSPTTYTRHLSALKFKELLEKETKGRVVVEVYPDGQLYKQAEEGEALALGSVQMLASKGGTPAKFVGEWDVFGLPTVWYSTPTNVDHILAFEKSEVCRRYITSKLEAKGIKLIAFLPSCTSGQMSTVKKPVRKIEDFKGLKIHNPQGAAKYFFLKSLGISSQLVPQTELVMALSTGMVDGEYGNVESLLANGYPAKYVHEWGTLMSGDSGASMLMNLAFWNSLPPDIKKIVEKVASKTEAWTITELFKAEAKARAKLKSRGVEFINLSPEMQEQVRARAAKPVLDWYIKRYPESASIILDEVARLDPRRKK